MCFLRLLDARGGFKNWIDGCEQINNYVTRLKFNYFVYILLNIDLAFYDCYQ